MVFFDTVIFKYRIVVLGKVMSEKKQTILLVHNYYRIPGGEDTVVANEKALLEKKDHTVYLYTRNNAEIQEAGMLAKIRLACTSVFSLKTYKEVKCLIQEKQIDIVHVHNTLSLISPSVYYAAFSCKVPVVQTLHNFRMVCPNGLLFREGKICEECIENGLGCALKHKCYRDSFLQTFVSCVILKIHRFLGTYKKINYIALTEFNKRKMLEANKKKCILSADKIWLKPHFTFQIPVELPHDIKNQYLYVGRLEEEKGIQFLLETWRTLPEAALIICGSGTKENWCRQYIEKHRMQNVHLLGQQTPEMVRQYMAQSQALIFSSTWYETWGMTIIESFSVGTPVIVNDLGNGAALVEEGVNGYHYARNNKESLANVVRHFVPLDRQKIKDIFQQKYGEENNYQILKQMYDALTKEIG